jgi:transposase
MNALSNDLRLRIVTHYESTPYATYASTAEHFSVGEATVSRLIRHVRRTGNVVPNIPARKPRVKIDEAWLQSQLEDETEKRLSDIVARYKQERNITVAISSIWYASQALGYSFKKKTIFARERDSERIQNLRIKFIEEQKALTNKKLYFIDESGFRLGSCTRYGWSKKGTKCFGSETGNSWQTMTMIGAMSTDDVSGFMTFTCNTTKAVFDVFLRSELINKLDKNSCVIMDNVSFHKNKAIVKMIEDTCAEIKYLPPYSPELNPIEKLWSKLKEILRRMDTITKEMFYKSAREALKYISTDDLQAWTKHCGYEIISS